MPIQPYGVLKGHVIDAKPEADDDTPHYQMRVVADTTHYRAALNVKSQETPSELLYLIDALLSAKFSWSNSRGSRFQASRGEICATFNVPRGAPESLSNGEQSLDFTYYEQSTNHFWSPHLAESRVQYRLYLVLWQTNSQAGERRKVEYPASIVHTTDWLDTKFLRIMQFRHHPTERRIQRIAVIYRDSAP